MWYYNKAVTEGRENKEIEKDLRESRGSENLEKLQKSTWQTENDMI